jgi:hypothetical protein
MQSQQQLKKHITPTEICQLVGTNRNIYKHLSGIVASLLISTVLYCSVAAIITLMVPFYEIDLDSPLATAFANKGLVWAEVEILI